MKKLKTVLCFLNKYLSLSIPILLLAACSNASIKTSDYKKYLGYTTATEFTRQGKAIPEKLKEMGFTEHTLIHYYYLDNVEYFAFSDWGTKKRGDIITWVVVDGEVKNYFKDIDDSQGEVI